jgi:glycosyltransferase involved in cell wall biosynthesis
VTDHLRIVHAIRSDAFAGVEQFVLRLAREQASAGHAVQVIGGAPDRMRGPLAAMGVRFSPSGGGFATARGIRAAARDADVVNTHMTAADIDGVVALSGRRTRPALVSTRHFTSPRGLGSGIPVDALIGLRIDAEISISHAVAASIGRPSTVVHSGVENVDTAEKPRRATVLMAQRLEPEKRTDLGIRAFAASGLAREGWVLEVAGDGAERARLVSLAAELDVDVRFLGFHDDVPALMASSGLLLAPCTVEGLGLAVVEAMAAGLPVVAADAGGHREILEGLDDRALYPAEDVDAAARALASLARDPAGRAMLAAAGRERQRAEFSLDAQARGTEAVYRTAIATRRGAGA